MEYRSWLAWACWMALLLQNGTLLARAESGQEASAKPKDGQQAQSEAKPSPPEPPRHVVKRGLIKVEFRLDGTFEPQSITDIAVRLEEWSKLEVVRAVPHGAKVKRGDLLVEFDLEGIDRRIADLKTDLQLADLDLKEAEENLQALEAMTPLDLAEAERRRRLASEDLAYFFRVDRDMSKKAADFMLKMAQNALDYEREELRQLEKMYKADELTEETEEIILRRQRDAVAWAEFQAAVARLRHDRTVETELPREQEKIEGDTRRVELVTQKAKVVLPLAVRRARLELDKKKIERARKEEELKRLVADRAAMVVKAPADGVVYYGQWTRGKWSGASSMAEKLRRGSTVSSGDTLMTLLQVRPMIVRVAVPERHLRWMRRGLKGLVEPAALPQLAIEAAVADVAAFPFSGGEFETRLTVNLDKQPEALVPGMACTVQFLPYANSSALWVPVKALFDDELDSRKQYVYVWTKQGKPKRQPVTVGQKTDEKAEILSGLREGDEVLVERPKEED